VEKEKFRIPMIIIIIIIIKTWGGGVVLPHFSTSVFAAPNENSLAVRWRWCYFVAS
jgi:hypothetical protein